MFTKGCNQCDDLQSQLMEQYTAVSELELGFKTLEEKLGKLKLKKDSMTVSMHQMNAEMIIMRGEMQKTARGQRYAIMGMVVSWMLLAYFWMCKE